MSYINNKESQFSKFVFVDTRMAWFWLVVRVYLGWQWLSAGWEKFNNSAWIGDKAGLGISGFVQGALAKTTGPHPDVSSWYAWFLQHVVLVNAGVWSYVIVYGEILVGLGLIFGGLTCIAAFFGFFMNINYLFAGTVSTNPLLLVLGIGVMLAGRIAGYTGVDRYLLPYIRGSFQKN